MIGNAHNGLALFGAVFWGKSHISLCTTFYRKFDERRKRERKRKAVDVDEYRAIHRKYYTVSGQVNPQYWW